jgi:hypothetical protein
MGFVAYAPIDISCRVCGVDRAEKGLNQAVQSGLVEWLLVFYVRLDLGLGGFFIWEGVVCLRERKGYFAKMYIGHISNTGASRTIDYKYYVENTPTQPL